MYELIAMTGLRRGEGVGLRWEDGDLDARVLRVRQTITDVAGHSVVGRRKTRGSECVVGLDSGTVGALAAHQLAQEAERREWRDGWTETGLVFTRGDGTSVHAECVTRHMQHLTAAAGLPRRRLHDLRHGVGVAAARDRSSAGGRVEAAPALLDRADQ